MIHIKLILLSAAAISALSIPALAQNADTEPSRFERADTNGDGVLTLAEVQSSARSVFSETDSNFDGYISADERNAARQSKVNEKAGEAFDQRDTNGDGFLSRDEALSALNDHRDRTERTERADRSHSDRDKIRERIKEKVDTNGDGTIDDAEKQAAREALRSRRNGADSRGRANSSDRQQGPSLDANGDGLISLTELDALIQARFTALDENADGVLSQNEARRFKTNLSSHHSGGDRKGR